MEEIVKPSITIEESHIPPLSFTYQGNSFDLFSGQNAILENEQQLFHSNLFELLTVLQKYFQIQTDVEMDFPHLQLKIDINSVYARELGLVHIHFLHRSQPFSAVFKTKKGNFLSQYNYLLSLSNYQDEQSIQEIEEETESPNDILNSPQVRMASQESKFKTAVTDLNTSHGDAVMFKIAKPIGEEREPADNLNKMSILHQEESQEDEDEDDEGRYAGEDEYRDERVSREDIIEQNSLDAGALSDFNNDGEEGDSSYEEDMLDPSKLDEVTVGDGDLIKEPHDTHSDLFEENIGLDDSQYDYQNGEEVVDTNSKEDLVCDEPTDGVYDQSINDREVHVNEIQTDENYPSYETESLPISSSQNVDDESLPVVLDDTVDKIDITEPEYEETQIEGTSLENTMEPLVENEQQIESIEKEVDNTSDVDEGSIKNDVRIDTCDDVNDDWINKTENNISNSFSQKEIPEPVLTDTEYESSTPNIEINVSPPQSPKRHKRKRDDHNETELLQEDPSPPLEVFAPSVREINSVPEPDRNMDEEAVLDDTEKIPEYQILPPPLKRPRKSEVSSASASTHASFLDSDSNYHDIEDVTDTENVTVIDESEPGNETSAILFVDDQDEEEDSDIDIGQYGDWATDTSEAGTQPM